MINWLQAKVHRPERGWDPIPHRWISEYSLHVDTHFEGETLDYIEAQIGPLHGRRVLDLGGGPGQYTVALAQRGGQVVWHDVSSGYRKVAEARAAANGVDVKFSLGYLEDVEQFFKDPFDLIFCRGAWAYCRNDRRFARLIYSLLKPGGAAYIYCVNPAFAPSKGLRRVQYFLNRAFGFKVGHPYSPHGRIARLFHAFPVERMVIDYSCEYHDKMLFVKSPRKPRRVVG